MQDTVTDKDLFKVTSLIVTLYAHTCLIVVRLRPGGTGNFLGR